MPHHVYVILGCGIVVVLLSALGIMNRINGKVAAVIGGALLLLSVVYSVALAVAVFGFPPWRAT